MLRIEEENEVFLTRGDSAYLALKLNDYEIQEGDTVTLTIKKSIDSEALFTTTVPLDQCIIIRPEDTKELDYGKYFYDVQINANNGDIYTVIEKSKFHLNQEVTL